MQGILEYRIEDLESYLIKHDFPGYASKQIFDWIYKKAVFDFQQMTNLSRQLRSFLKSNFRILSIRLIKKQVSSDGAQKFLFQLGDKQSIESALIPVTRRITACISTQVGCKFACRFCASGLNGWQRDLSAGEIIEQVIYLKNILRQDVSNLVFMGIGEPLDNYDNVLKAIRILNSPYGLNIGARKITISTCGIIPGIQRLAQENLQVELSISLHAADNKLRSFLMPINKKYPLKQLIQACQEYFKKTKRQITFEYVLIKGINSDLQQANRLAKLLANLDAKVNLIPASDNKTGFLAANKLDTLFFRDALLKAGIPATIRRSRGTDIEAACGQLRLREAQ